MTYEEKRNFLSLYKDNTLRIQGLTHELEKWEQIAQSIGVKLDDMPKGSGTGDKVSNAASNAVDIINTIKSEIEVAKAERERVREVINGQKYRQRLLLEYRYINGLKVSEIAEIIGKSDKWVGEMLRNIVAKLDI